MSTSLRSCTHTDWIPLGVCTGLPELQRICSHDTHGAEKLQRLDLEADMNQGEGSVGKVRRKKAVALIYGIWATLSA